MKLIAVAEEANPMCSAVFDPSNCHAMLGIKTPNPGVIACTDVLLIGTGCNDNPVDGVLFELSCSILSLIPITNQTFCNDTPSAIPRLFTFNGVFGNVIGESNKDNGDCSALLTSCFITGDNGIHNQTAACVLGMSLAYLYLTNSEDLIAKTFLLLMKLLKKGLYLLKEFKKLQIMPRLLMIWLDSTFQDGGLYYFLLL
uniref:Uncharacterized protein n=1 Tax=Ditylum brightwellii TaxID=49249 RepID=A0A7S4S7L2_9STRA